MRRVGPQSGARAVIPWRGGPPRVSRCGACHVAGRRHRPGTGGRGPATTRTAVAMSLSRLVISRGSILGGLAVAVAALLIAAGTASAQQPGHGPPPGASKLWPWNVQGAYQVVTSPRPVLAVTPPA